MSDTILVIGGGITGIQAALDSAEAGSKVVLVERQVSIGGKMAALDKNFPTLDCSLCIEAPKMSDVSAHPNIEILQQAEVTSIEGEAGDFTVGIEQKQGFVTDACTRCDLCSEACPQTNPNEFDEGLMTRKAIYTPFPQAIPSPYAIDLSVCLNDPPNYLPCSRCVDVCGPDCIDFSLPHKTHHVRRVGSVIVATGFDVYDETAVSEYNYGNHPDILSALEFERLVDAAGPTQGEIICPSDGRHPQSIGFVLCAGSRDQRHVPYCSRTCCMFSIKEAYQALDHGVREVSLHYMDIRAYGKGFDDFYRRTEEAGASFIRGRPSAVRILPNGGGPGSLELQYEEVESGSLVSRPYDMIVLAQASIPSNGADKLCETLGVGVDEDGFVATPETGGDTIETAIRGIYSAGCATGPKDIPDSVAEGSAAAARALDHITVRTFPEAAEVESVDMEQGERVGVFLCDCGSNIAGTIDIPDLVSFVENKEKIVHAEEVMFACAGNTQDAISETIKEKNLTRVLVGACSPKTHNQTFMNCAANGGLNPYLMELTNLRNHNSWVHKKDKEGANSKARDMVSMGLETVLRAKPLTPDEQPVTQAALVIGGGVAGMAAATRLAGWGIETHLVEKSSDLGGRVRHFNKVAPSGKTGAMIVAKLAHELVESGAKVHLGTVVENIGGHIGQFQASLSNGETVEVGGVVVATGAEVYEATEFGYGEKPEVVTNLDWHKHGSTVLPDDAENVSIISCVGARQDGRGCSRYCCQVMIDQAIRMTDEGKRVRVVAKDIRTFGRHAEEAYEVACRRGVQFLRYSEDESPQEAITYADGRLHFQEQTIAAEISVPTDALVLSLALKPGEMAVADQLKLSRDPEGFLLEMHPKLGPVEAAVQGVYLAGSVQSPKDIRDSIAQGLGAATKAGMLLSRDRIEKEPITCIIDPDPCIACGKCAKVCPYDAIIIHKEEKFAEVISAACQGCGGCSPECPTDAITMPGFTDDQVLAQIDAALAEDAHEKVLAFACNWCSYAGADTAGIAKLQYPPTARVIRVMCSGRIDERFVMNAFAKGAGAVLVTGCHIGDCHYLTANHHTEKRFARWQRKLGRVGIDPDRLQLKWISASEGIHYATKMKEISEYISDLDADEVAASAEAIRTAKGVKL